MKTKPAFGWGIECHLTTEPYLDSVFYPYTTENFKNLYSYEKIIAVALVPLAEWKRLKRLQDEVAKTH